MKTQIIIIIAFSVGVLCAVVIDRAESTPAESTQRTMLEAKAQRLDDYCRLVRITLDGVAQELDAHKAWAVEAAVAQWQGLAAFDGRALVPCVHPGVADMLSTCAGLGSGCVRTQVQIARASLWPDALKVSP